MDNVPTLLNKVKQCALAEEIPTLSDLLAIGDVPLADLVRAAHEVTAAKASSVFNFCATMH